MFYSPPSFPFEVVVIFTNLILYLQEQAFGVFQSAAENVVFSQRIEFLSTMRKRNNANYIYHDRRSQRFKTTVGGVGVVSLFLFSFYMTDFTKIRKWEKKNRVFTFITRYESRYSITQFELVTAGRKRVRRILYPSSYRGGG